MSAPDLAFLSAAELGRRFAARSLSPVDVVSALLERIARLDPALRAFITVTPERALAEAKQAEAALAGGRGAGPLHGVPIALKDLFDTAGLRTTAGSRILADHVPARDAGAVARLRAAGAVLLGKLNMHEFAYGTTNTNPHYGACANPWDRARVPGGSSGGSAVALVTGMCALSLGTDTGGSIRIPASACGVVGLKPTFGRVTRRGVTPLSWSLDHVGPLARTVEDAALVLNAVAGPDPEDPWCAARPAEDFARDLERGARGLALGVPAGYFDENVQEDVAAVVREAVAVLAREGASLRAPAWPSVAQAHTAAHVILASEASAYHGPWLRERPQDYGEDVRRNLELGHLLPAVGFVDARRMQAQVRAEALAALRECDLLAVPVLPVTPPRIGEPVSREAGVAWNRFMTPFNLTGLPALSVPCGFDRAGMPVGLQLVGRPFEEATVLRAGRAFERATEWHTRRPPD